MVKGSGGGTETHYFGSEGEARTFQLSVETGLKCPEGPPAPTDALDLYLDGLRQRGLAESSVVTAKWQLLPFVREIADLSRVTKAQIEKRLAVLPSNASKSNTLKEIRRFLDFGLKQGWLAKHAAANVTVVGKIPTGKAQLTRAEARVLVHHLVDDPSEGATFTMLLLMTGARKSEVLFRKVREVDVTPCYNEEGLEYGVIEIRKAKSRAGVRIIRVFNPALTRLRKQVEGKEFDEYVFPGDTTNKPHGIDWPNDVLKRQCLAAKVTVVPPHGLRGTAASWGTEVGVLGAAISRDLGHAGEAVTKRHYVEPNAGAASRAGRLAEALAVTPEIPQ